MEVTFYLDPETGMPHIWEHGVTEQEALDVLHRPGTVIKGKGESQIALGQTAAGRYLKVISVPQRHVRV